ncbi:hypothetical protein VE25_11775 [Devosia geojensis]|uniref:Uncharacterized protein n=1 Tax=Devosia geojensis TaxID=443610 RepID=A0A0F5FSX3_9HYPH|nr:hypothetical protein VE25_11775 [Devosia geojensis]
MGMGFFPLRASLSTSLPLSQAVIPAKAGTQYTRNNRFMPETRRSSLPDTKLEPSAYWVPAFAGMTSGVVWDRGLELPTHHDEDSQP